MGRIGRRLIALAGCVAAACSAQSTLPAGELEPDLQRQLADLDDYQLNFDQPGVYALLEHLQHNPTTPGRYQEPLTRDDLADLLARPGDSRGRPVRVRGIVGRNSTWQRSAGVGSARPVWQLELQVPESPVAATVLLTEPAGDIALNAEVEVTGYFALVRNYYDRRGRLRPALLLLGHAPDRVVIRQPRDEAPRSDWTAGLVLTTGVAAIAWLLLRRWSRRAVPVAARPPEPAAFSVADEFEAWARSEAPEEEPDEEPPAR